MGKYNSEYKSLKFYYLGGLWGYAIIHLIDSKGIPKVRLAKCKKANNNLPETDKFQWEELDVNHLYDGDLKQINRISFKRKEEVEDCFDQLMDEF